MLNKQITVTFSVGEALYCALLVATLAAGAFLVFGADVRFGL